MSTLTDRARLMAEFSEDGYLLLELANRVDFLERDQERNLTQLADKDAA